MARADYHSISLAAGISETIARHCLAGYPHEACGALVGRVSGAGVLELSAAVPIKNVAKVRGADRFTVDPVSYGELEAKLSRQNDGSVIAGFFHSHPNSPARPSSVDLEMARGVFEFSRVFYVYVILSVQDGSAGELAFWRLNDGVSGFISVPVRAAGRPGQVQNE